MIKKIVLYIIIGTVLTVAPLYYMNNVLFSDSSLVINGNTINTNYLLNKANSKKIDIPDNASDVELVYNKGYISYDDSGTLHLLNVTNNSLSKEIYDNDPVVYAVALDDRDIIMYFTYAKDKLSVKTYDLDKSEGTLQKTIDINNFYKVADVKYSSLTNVIYIDAQTKSNNTIYDSIYRIDLMKELSRIASNKKITSLSLLNNDDVLIYENSDHNIYIKGKLFSYHGDNKYKLLGVDKNDDVYISSIKNPKEILVLRNSKVLKTIQLEDHSFSSVINKNNKIYLVYSDYIFDLQDNKKIDIKPGSTILDLNGSIMLVKDSEGIVALQNMDI